MKNASEKIESEEAEAFEILDGAADCGFLVLCDHAQAIIPAEFDALGLSSLQLKQHIAYDIGAEMVSRTIAGALGCPAVFSRFSRLLIDPNRGTNDPTLVMRIADGSIVPGNARIDDAGIAARIARFYAPYDDAIARTIATMRKSGINPVILAMHSFTPRMKGVDRPWHATVIWNFDPRFNLPLLRALKTEPGLVVGENEPYQSGYSGDTLDRHCIRAGLAHALVEIRQDLIADPAAAQEWGLKLARLLRPLLEDPTLRHEQVFGAHA